MSNAHKTPAFVFWSELMIKYSKIRYSESCTMSLIKIGTIQQITNSLKEKGVLSIIKYPHVSVPEQTNIRLLYSVAESIYGTRLEMQSSSRSGWMTREAYRMKMKNFITLESGVLNMTIPNFPLYVRYIPEKIKIEGWFGDEYIRVR